ncbi:probable E3 ubiquitin-protein ligase HERC6 [Diadema antillarum]|uniref:probable E3 ubiquitin-protein ligase HERC6 n=1 Tax=Diadema antillarum TaxID=105358 RepID=UPI003A8BCD93
MESPQADALAPNHEEKCNHMRDVFNRLVEANSPSPELLAEVKEVLSPGFLGQAFGNPQGETDHTLNLVRARQTFGILQNKDFHLKLVADIIHEQYNGCWSRLCPAQYDHALLKSLSLILVCPAFDHPDEAWSRRIIVLVAETLNKLGTNQSQDAFEILVNWWKCDGRLLRWMILVLKKGLLALRRSTAYEEFGTVFVLINALKHLNEVNERNGRIVSHRLFYIRGIGEVELFNHLVAHERARDPNMPQAPNVFNWIHHLFLLDVASKWTVIKISTNSTRDCLSFKINFQNFLKLNRNYISQAFPHLGIPLFRDMHSPVMKFVDIRRGSGIIQSAMENVDRYWSEGPATWLKPLEVQFKDEYATDLGGPTKEFFHEFFREVMDTNKLSFFRRMDEKNMSSHMWFNAENKDFQTLEKIGFLFFLCLHNATVVTLPFPLLLYEKLLNPKPIAYEDLRSLDPKLYGKLEGYRKCSAEELEGLKLSFDGLQPDGENIDVTQDNLQEYIDRKSIHQLAIQQFVAFHLGFNRIPKPELFYKLRSEELRDVIMGEEFDWMSFENSTLYKLPYRADHPVIRLFWSVFHEFDEDRKKLFLKFLTGADHLPIGGFRSLDFTIRRYDTRKNNDGADPSEIGPVAMTCPGFISMGLPEYESEDDVRFGLLQAIEKPPSFNLERPRNGCQ